MIKKGIGVCLVVVTACIFFYMGCQCAFGFDDQYLPPIFKGKIDFAGVRFMDRDTNGTFTGYKSRVFKKGYRLLLEPNPTTSKFAGYFPTGPSRKLILVKDMHEDETGPHKTRVHRLKEIHTLADLQGFVAIKSKQDAFEFLRFGSSVIGFLHWKPAMTEVFCVDEIDTSSLALLVTRPDCLAFGFLPPEIQTQAKRSSKDGEDKDDDAHAVGDEDNNPKGKWFIIRRTVYSAPPPNKGFLRITEEVGPAGQWRIISEQPITQRNAMNEKIFR